MRSTGQIDLMPAATDHMQDINDFHNLLLVIITIITLFVLGLLLWVMVRYNARANPKPANVVAQHADRGRLDDRPDRHSWS